MNRRLLPLLVLALFVASGSLCVAQEAKPVVVISFSGYDALRADVQYIGQLVGQPGLAGDLDDAIASATEDRGLEGLDTKRPWGAAVFSKDEEFSVAVFLPTTDIEALAGTLGALDFQATDQGDGTYQVQTPMQPLIMKERNGWALMADQTATFDNLPDDPTTLLDPMVGKYNLGVTAHIANLPEGVRQMFVAQIGMGAAMGMQQQPDETDEQYALRRAMTERSIQQLTTMMDELERFMFGINVDAEAGAGTLEVAVRAKPGTKTAEQFALLKDATTNFAGFDQPDATISALMSSKLTEEDVEQFKVLLAGIHSAAKEELARQDLGDDDMAAAERLMAELFEVLEENVDARVTDGGMVAKMGPQRLTLVAGMHVADGPKIESLLKQLLEQLVKEQPEVQDHLQLDAETHEGVNLHVLSIPTEKLDEGAEPMRKLVGDQLDLIVGVGPNSLYLAAGRDAAGELKQVIDASRAAPGKAISPAKMTVALQPIVQMVAQLADDDMARQMAGMMAFALSQSPDKDRVTMETRFIPNGSMTRITLEEGVLRLIGTGVTMATQMMMAPGF